MLDKQLALLIASIMKCINFNVINTDSLEFRIIVQKIGYVLQKIGCDLGLKFGWYTLGPYTRTLQNYYNVIASILDDMKYNNDNIDKELHEELKMCGEKTVVFLNEYKSYVGELNVKTLEILTSLMMLCTDIYPKPRNPIEELLKLKKGIPLDLIEKTWRFLVDKNICVLIN